MKDETKNYIDNLDGDYSPALVRSPNDLSSDENRDVVLKLIKFGEGYKVIPVQRRNIPKKVRVVDKRNWLDRFTDDLTMIFSTNKEKKKILQKIDNRRTFAQIESKYHYAKACAEIIDGYVTELNTSYRDLRNYWETSGNAVAKASLITRDVESKIEKMIHQVEIIDNELDSECFEQDRIAQNVEDGSLQIRNALESEKRKIKKTIPQLATELKYLADLIQDVELIKITCMESLNEMEDALIKADKQQKGLKGTLSLYESLTLPKLRAARTVQNLTEIVNIVDELKADMIQVDEMFSDTLADYLETPDSKTFPDTEIVLAKKEIKKLTRWL